MRASSFTTLALGLALSLSVSACGSSDSDTGGGGGGGGDAVDAANNLDVCGLVPKATIAPLAGGAAERPSNTSLHPRVGTCTWHSAELGKVVIITVADNGTSRAGFADLCATGTPPWPTITGLGFGVAACGRFEANGGNLWVLHEATTATIGVYSSVPGGTQAQAAEVLRVLSTNLRR